MTHDEIKKMMEAYVEQYADRFKKVAAQAYVDGAMDVLKALREKLETL
ncbi:MAG: hypothetical protein IKY48_06745 [Bacteroidales bacterium]|nr:hypothetical protein [Bacteroidales bacterium]